MTVVRLKASSAQVVGSGTKVNSEMYPPETVPSANAAVPTWTVLRLIERPALYSASV